MLKNSLDSNTAHIAAEAVNFPVSKERPLSRRDLIGRFKRRPFREQLQLLRQLSRGWLKRRIFDAAEWPLVGRGAYLSKANGEITLGRFVKFEGSCQVMVSGRPQALARLSIGEFSSIGPSTVLNVAQQLDIGKRCLISWNCDIMDTDFHSIEMLDEAQNGPVSKPVKIGDDVWVGAHTIILKGVTIGDNCVIGAGSVVTSSMPPNSLVAGNPARVIRQIKGWKR